MSVAFFDLDRTLLDCNSGRLWLSHEWRGGRLRTTEVARGAWWLLKYSLGNHDLTHAYARAVRALEGELEAAMADRTQRWFDAHVAHRLRPGGERALGGTPRARRCLGFSRPHHHPTLQRVRSNALDRDAHIATEFEVKEGVFTGEVFVGARSCQSRPSARVGSRKGWPCPSARFTPTP